jgi:hypothetical protein
LLVQAWLNNHEYEEECQNSSQYHHDHRDEIHTIHAIIRTASHYRSACNSQTSMPSHIIIIKTK